MSHYILRREGQDYPAPSLDALRQWAKDGRVLPADMIYAPDLQAWRRADTLEALAGAFERRAEAKGEAKQQFWLKKGKENYPAASLEVVLSWAREGNIAPQDMIFHPQLGRWLQAGDSPTICDLLPAKVGAGAPRFSRADDPLRPPSAPVEARAQTSPLHPGINPLSALTGKATTTPTRAAEGRAETGSLSATARVDAQGEVDVKALMRLFYDVARTFMVTRDMRPGEKLPNECRLPTTGDDFKGWEKRDIYLRLAERMQGHLEGALTAARPRLSEAQRQQLDAFSQRLNEVLDTFHEVIPLLGQRPPERVVVGNVGRPKMTPDEEEAMLRVDYALKGLFAVKLV
ncbi:hypothetical protein KKF91_03260 [Myxococcota bacterium]|nr:hypothetical protein [Myxococcota bacterium]MBU1429560.1 hypothetical protein [Myxococcota bacterium]MBU1900371.1 hypothetical protein [Myxococcota bacterium]